MKSLLLSAVFCFTFSIFSISAQTTNTTPGTEDDVVVINTNLIQVDAVVTDKDGKQVRNLTAQDFEILQNGREQKITNFSYVTVLSAQNSGVESLEKSKAATPIPPVVSKLKPEQVRRTIALVVDDLGLSHSSMIYVRKALKKFVDEQMLPGDLVAVVRTGVGLGALQQFTNDKKQLYAAIERVRYNLNSRRGFGEFASLGQNNISQDGADGEAEVNQMRDTIYTKGTLGALQFIVKGVGKLPGRKAVILFSDGFPLIAENDSGGIEENGRITDPLRRLIDDANRAGVVINSIDPQGVIYVGPSAADSFSSAPFRTPGRGMLQTLSRQFGEFSTTRAD